MNLGGNTFVHIPIRELSIVGWKSQMQEREPWKSNPNSMNVYPYHILKRQSIYAKE
jgi:hypothetical protein